MLASWLGGIIYRPPLLIDNLHTGSDKDFLDYLLRYEIPHRAATGLMIFSVRRACYELCIEYWFGM